MERPRLLLPILALVLLFPATASANSMTAMDKASGLHLFIGNALIGVLEGGLLAAFFKCRPRRAILLLILANYVSATVGAFLAGGAQTLADIDLENVFLWLTALVLIAFVVTVILEFPFVLCALRGQERPVRRAVKATLTVNSVSYVLLLVWYWHASDASLMREFRVVPAGELSPGEGYSAYYMTPGSDRVMRMDLNRPGSPEEVCAEHSHQESAFLARYGSPETGFTLQVLRPSDELTQLFAFSGDQLPIYQGGTDLFRNDLWRRGPVPSFVENADWRFSIGFQPVRGILWGENKATKEAVLWAMDTPFVSWRIMSATHLPGDFLIFQLGKDRICLVHVSSRRISVLARGTSPIVVKGEPPPIVPVPLPEEK